MAYHDLTAPLLTVTSATDTAIGLTPTSTQSGDSLSFLGVSTTGPAGILRPGESVSKTLYFRSGSVPGSINQVHLQVIQTDDLSPFDLQPLLPASTLAQPNFAAIYAQLELMIGPTWANYVSMLASNATLLPSVMGDNSDPTTLIDLEVTAATAAIGTSIAGLATTTDPLVPVAGQAVQATNQATGDSYVTYALLDESFIFADVIPGTYTFTFQGATISSSPTAVVAQGQAVQGVALNLIAIDAPSGTRAQSAVTDPSISEPSWSGGIASSISTASAPPPNPDVFGLLAFGDVIQQGDPSSQGSIKTVFFIKGFHDVAPVTDAEVAANADVFPGAEIIAVDWDGCGRSFRPIPPELSLGGSEFAVGRG